MCLRVLPGSMLGKGCGVRRIAASVVGRVRAVPLGIKHDPRRVGGLCSPSGTRAQAYPTPPRLAAVGGRQLNYCCQSTAAATEASSGAFGGLFGCSQHTKSKPGRTNIRLEKKWVSGGLRLWQLKYRCQSTAVAMEANLGGFGGLVGCS